MKYKVDKIKLIDLLHQRPALIREVQGLDENFCILLMSVDSKRFYGRRHGWFGELYGRIPHCLRTLEVTKALLRSPNLKTSGYVDSIPRAQLPLLSETERIRIIKDKPQIAQTLDDLTPNEMVTAIRYEYDNHPRNSLRDLFKDKITWNANTLLTLIEHKVYPLDELPINWTKDLALRVVQINKACLEYIPTHLVDSNVLAAGIEQDLSECKNIPESAWSGDLAGKAMEHLMDNYFCIPTKFILRADTEKAIKETSKTWGDYPREVRDYDLLVLYFAYRGSLCDSDDVEWTKEIIPDKEKFILDIVKAIPAEETRRFLFLDDSLEKLGIYIPTKCWPDIISIRPDAIKLLAKENQSKKVVETFLTTASPEVKDSCAKYINLGRIDEAMAPFLVGCDSTILTEIRDKFLTSDDPSSPLVTEMVIDVAPSLFAQIKNELF